MRTRSLLWASGFFALGLSVGACASGADWRSLAAEGSAQQINARLEQRSSAQAAKNQEFSPAEFKEFLRGLLERALKTSELFPLEELSSCGQELRPALRKLAEGHGARADEAALLLAEHDWGWVSRSEDKPEHASLARALAAYRLDGCWDGESRREALEDPDARVRRGALHAALSSRSAADASQLAELALRDPEEANRRLALQALGAQKSAALAALWPKLEQRGLSGAERQQALLALCATVEEPEIETLLLQLLGRGRPEDSLQIAATLVTRSGLRPELQELLDARVRELARSGSLRQRRQALSLLVFDETSNQALWQELYQGQDPGLTGYLLLRKLAYRPQDGGVLAALEEQARGEGEAAFEAKIALARLGKTELPASLLGELKASGGSKRQVLLKALASLGLRLQVARALLQSSPEEQRKSACALLAQAD